MPPDSDSLNDPQKWLKYALADLKLAQIQLPEGTMYEQLCFLLQQSVEKSLKGLLVHHDVDFPRIHNIQGLIDLLPAGIPRSELLLNASRLSHYAVIVRYPGEDEPIEEDEYLQALEIAREVVSWVSKEIRSG